MKKLINHIKRWNNWRKYNTNAWWYKILVLLGICHSPSFIYWWSIKEGYLGFLKRNYSRTINMTVTDDGMDKININLIQEETDGDTSENT